MGDPENAVSVRPLNIEANVIVSECCIFNSVRFFAFCFGDLVIPQHPASTGPGCLGLASVPSLLRLPRVRDKPSRLHNITVNRFFMKLFRTSTKEIVHYCQTVFGCELPSVLLVTRYNKFIKKLACTFSVVS